MVTFAGIHYYAPGEKGRDNRWLKLRSHVSNLGSARQAIVRNSNGRTVRLGTHWLESTAEDGSRVILTRNNAVDFWKANGADVTANTVSGYVIGAGMEKVAIDPQAFHQKVLAYIRSTLGFPQ